MQITRNDITRTEKLLFSKGGSFYDEREERYKVIECIDRNIEVDACPGSGKTTCLLAKLILLAEQMPFPDGRGICVLTHTNVAIDEVKRTIGTKANKLFNYPNHFGTFQSFVDKFLAIPYYANRYKKRPIAIDVERLASRFKKTYLEYDIRDQVNIVKSYLHIYQLFDKINFKRAADNNYDLIVGIDGIKLSLKKPRSKNDWSEAEKTQLYRVLFRLRKKVFSEDSILSYDDAYFLANEYLANIPNIRNTFSNRFSYVFIDEMQDSYPHQIELIESLFNDSVIIQKIGDPAQAIYSERHSPDSNSGKVRWKPTNSALSISSSKRFNNSIAKILRTVCIKDNSALIGNNAIEEIPPHIITYTNGTIDNVIEKFAELINRFGLDREANDNYPIMAIGWVGDGKPDKITIQSYYKNFSKQLGKEKQQHFETLKSYLKQDKTNSCKVYSDNIIEGLLQVLYLSGKKEHKSKGDRYFNKTSALVLIKAKDENLFYQLLEHIAKWSRLIHNHNDIMNQGVVDEVREYFSNTIPSIFEFTLNDNAKAFINADEEPNLTIEQIKNQNSYSSKSEKLKHIKIKVGNVHSVKGETHSATLYMETFFQGKTCSEYIIDQMAGLKFDSTAKNVVYKTKCLQMAYVGMSRPKYFLAFAAREDRITPREEELKKNGWEIVAA